MLYMVRCIYHALHQIDVSIEVDPVCESSSSDQ